jgi:anti-sigma regulatory factor (Ser/Thr protein kinase)
MEQLCRFTETITLSNMASLRQQWKQVMVAVGGDPVVVADMILALNEAVINSVRHGYQGQSGWVQIEIWRAGRSLVVKQYDAAPAFDPTVVPPPDTTLPLALRTLGGMGVHMMRNFTDEMHYERTSDGRNLLTLIKYDAFT